MRRAVAGLALAACLVAWWNWPQPVDPAPAEAPSEVKRVVTRFEPAAAERSDDVFAQAARGELGDEYRQRVCDLCATGHLTGANCAPCPAEEEPPAELAELHVDVVDESGRPEDRARLIVTGCDVLQRGGRGAFTVKPGRCLVRAMRRDGALFARSPEVAVEVGAGAQEYVQLELASARTGGLGVSIHPDAEGIRVAAVMPGTPAAELGLGPGDLIVEVDGMDARELGLHGFIDAMTGPEGTEVEFVVRVGEGDDAVEEPLVIVRRYLERS